MGRALEVISFAATAPGSAGAAMAAVSGDSLTLREGSGISLLAMFGSRHSGGLQRITSPLMHDTTVGISSNIPELLTAGGVIVPTQMSRILPYPQPLYAQDRLTAFGTGSSTAGDIELGALLVEYQDLPGVDGLFIDATALDKRGVNMFEQPVTIISTGGGVYSGSRAINFTTDLFKANTDYAVLGAQCITPSGTLLLRLAGVEWGNLGLPLPVGGPYGPCDATQWFVELSDATGSPCIPVFNSANRSRTLLSALGNENSISLSVSLTMVELSMGKKR